RMATPNTSRVRAISPCSRSSFHTIARITGAPLNQCDWRSELRSFVDVEDDHAAETRENLRRPTEIAETLAPRLDIGAGEFNPFLAPGDGRGKRMSAAPSPHPLRLLADVRAV